MQVFIDEREITERQLDDWKLKRAKKAFKIYGQKKQGRGADVCRELDRLAKIKADFSYEQTVKRLRSKLNFTSAMMKFAAALSRKRKCSVTYIKVSALTAREVSAGIEKLMTETSKENYRINLAAYPEHYALRPTSDGRFEVIETPGNSPLPSRFYITFNDESGLITPKDSAYPYQSTGTARLQDGTPIGGVRHQFKDIPGGCEARLCVEFPSIVPKFFIKAHQMHLACEFSYWIRQIKRGAEPKQA